jgi:hypothetical protein
MRFTFRQTNVQISRSQGRSGLRPSISFIAQILLQLLYISLVVFIVWQSRVSAYTIDSNTISIGSLTSKGISVLSSVFSRPTCNYNKNTRWLTPSPRQSSFDLHMVNFGPYGDFLNSKVNDEDDYNKTNNDISGQITSNDTNNNNNNSVSNRQSYCGPTGSNMDVDSKGRNGDDYYYYTDSNHNSDTKNIEINSYNVRQQILPQKTLDKIDSDIAAGTFRLYEVDTISMKPGGLRLFLVMYLLGNMAPKLWKVDRPSSDEYIIDLYFHDHSAILSIELIPASNLNNNDHGTMESDDSIDNQDDTSSKPSKYNMIHINRIGSSPSSIYKLHEATILQGIINEFISCATDPTIPISDRLITFTNSTIESLQNQCQILPFG